MKTVRITNFLRMPILAIILSVFCFFVGLGFFEAGIRENSADGIVLGCLLLIPSVIFMCIPFFLGIKISPRRVTVIYYQEFRTFRYKDVKYIEIGLDDDGVYGKIKAEGKKVYDFYLGDIDLEPTRSILPARCWNAKARLSERYIKKTLEKLKKCPKLKVFEYKK